MLGLTDVDLRQTRFYQDVLAEGIQEGLREGESEVLLRLITRKFGSPDASVCHRIASAEAETLLMWAECILTAETLDEVWCMEKIIEFPGNPLQQRLPSWP